MTSITAFQGDITNVEVDVIVNAANASLQPGRGVDGAIHAAGGPTIREETAAIVRSQGVLPTGEAVITTAGLLPARHVIHTVGPIWGQVTEDEAVRLLRSCYTTSLDLAAGNDCRTVAFPNISTGVYRFPKQLAAENAVESVSKWVDANPDTVDRVMFVCFNGKNYGIYRGLLDLT